MDISLTPEMEELINEKVKSGMYASASEVIRDGLRLLQEQDELHGIKLETLKREIEKGIEELDRGEGIPGEQVFAEMRERNETLRAKK
ncbi:MAG: type II toxin-antitoxin system ParD family antitoxin [Blastocatellia bacterium]|nr:type II toxin-antitoxin system ParD family antitoxin [Blastocatellia bacterium]